MAGESSLREGAVTDGRPEVESVEGPQSASGQTADGKAGAQRQPLPPEVLGAKPPGDSLTWVVKGF